MISNIHRSVESGGCVFASATNTYMNSIWSDVVFDVSLQLSPGKKLILTPHNLHESYCKSAILGNKLFLRKKLLQ